MQDTKNRINQHDLIDLPTRIMVVGYRYKVDFGPSVKPQVHLVDKQLRCSCELGITCLAIEAVAEYLRNGGQQAPDPMPLCPICGAETFRDRNWDNKYTKELGWRCTVGGLTHFLQARTERIKEAFRRKQSAASEHESATGRSFFLMEEIMQIHTLTDIEVEPRPVQIGEPFRCWECGLPDQGGRFLIINNSPLEAFADHIYYMRLACEHNPRCVRLGDAITPLQPLDRSIDENLACVREGLSHLSKVLPPERQNQEPVARIIYLLVAGCISPQTAINQLQSLMQTTGSFIHAGLPIIE